MDLIFHLKKNYNFLSNSTQKFFSKKIFIYTKEESLDILLENSYSVSRFGDGEIRLISGEDIEFQKSSILLSERLKEILISDLFNHKVCVSGVFQSLYLYTSIENYFWRKHLVKFRRIWLKYLSSKRKYLNTFITRPYMPYKNRLGCENYFNRIKGIWNCRDVIIIEGKLTRFGMSNTLLDNCNSIQRVLCPSTNAFESYNSIIDVVSKIGKNHLILSALGPTATILCYDLTKFGIQAIDIGHLDIEYDWFLLKAKNKIEIKEKYTNEAIYDKSSIEKCSDERYLMQVVAEIN
jgi:glycosyltransferase family protein